MLFGPPIGSQCFINVLASFKLSLPLAKRCFCSSRGNPIDTAFRVVPPLPPPVAWVARVFWTRWCPSLAVAQVETARDDDDAKRRLLLYNASGEPMLTFRTEAKAADAWEKAGRDGADGPTAARRLRPGSQGKESICKVGSKGKQHEHHHFRWFPKQHTAEEQSPIDCLNCTVITTQCGFKVPNNGLLLLSF